MSSKKLVVQMEAALFAIANYLSYESATGHVPLREQDESPDEYRLRLTYFAVDRAKSVAAARALPRPARTQQLAQPLPATQALTCPLAQAVSSENNTG